MKNSVITPKLSLQSKAVNIANKRLWEKYPELNGRKLTSSPNDRKYRVEWVKLYRESKTVNTSPTNKVANKVPVLPCQKQVANRTVAPTSPPTTERGKAKCKFDSLSVSKSNRRYTLNIKPGQDNNKPKTLEIVAGNKINSEEVTIKLESLVQSELSCNHLNNTFNYFLDKEELTAVPTATQLRLKAVSNLHDNWEIWKATPNIYNLNASTCGAHAAATVAVYPDTNYVVNIQFPQPGQSTEKQFTPSSDSGYIEIEKTKSLEWGVSIAGSILNDGKKLEIEAEFKNEIEQFKRISTISKGLQDHLSIIKNVGITEPISFKIKYPNLKFEYSGKWIELEGSNLCDFENKLSFRLDPLIGADIKVDIVAAGFVSLGGPFGTLLNQIRNLAKKNIEVKFDFMVSGEASGGWTGGYIIKEKRWNSKDKDITAKLGAEIDVSVEGKLDLIVVYIGGGAEGKVKGEIEFKAQWDIDAKFSISSQHNGIKGSIAFFRKSLFVNIFNRKKELQGKVDYKAVDFIKPQEYPTILYP